MCGSIKSDQDVHDKLSVKYHIPVGETDSEFAFCWILDQIHIKYKDKQPDDIALFTYIASLSKQLNDLGVFNIIITNGECLFAYCSNNLHWITRKAPFGKANLIDAEVEVNFNQVTTDKDIVTVIATQPLTDNEDWHKMTKGQWHLFKLGCSVASGQEQ